MDDLGTLASRGKDVLRSRLGFFFIFGGFRDSILKAFWVPWIQKCVCLHGSLLSAGTCRCSQLIRLIASCWSNETLLALGGCHLGGSVPPIWYPGAVFAPREHSGGPFWHLGTTLEDLGSSRMDTRGSGMGFSDFGLIWGPYFERFLDTEA